jgi:hypothetical protein
MVGGLHLGIDFRHLDSHNLPYSLALDFILHTSRSVFLTGKAGTGKTTLLKKIRESTHKKCVVLAPTGVAAINAGGSTIHSFLNIPPYGPFLPINRNELPSGSIIDRRRLFQNIRMSADKREMINDLEMIIIDEVSMVRCDLLDAVDVLLRTFRQKHQLPFGGVQMVFIGDLFQLPPVVKDHEWPILAEFYSSPFFFDARALADRPPLTIELTNVYRQRDQRFINLLNNIRGNEIEEWDMNLLEERFDPGFHPEAGSDCIVLTTHNYKADAINVAELNKIPKAAELIKGKIEGEFPENALPAEMELYLKEGAQVMFIRNDYDEQPRFFNGKIAAVSRIENGDVFVTFRDQEGEMKVPRVEWRNVRYTYDTEKEKIIEDALGTFEQLPLRLAWAITIHKSQGLTFEKAVIDVGDSFAPGQVYVALSRCVSMEGLVLRSRVRPDSLRVDSRVLEFVSRCSNSEVLQALLEKEKRAHQREGLLRAFDFTKLSTVIDAHVAFIPGKKITDYKSAVDLGESLKARIAAIISVATRFQIQLSSMVNDGAEADDTQLKERVKKAIGYFAAELTNGLLIPINAQMEKRGPKTKKYIIQLRGLKAAAVRRLEQLKHIYLGDELLSTGIAFPDLDKENRELAKPVRGEKVLKGNSQRETLELHQKGIALGKIAELRGLSLSTVIGHLAEFVSSGIVGIEALVPTQKADVIAQALNDLKGEPLVLVKSKLGNDYSYAEIKAVVSHQIWSKDTLRSQ